MRPEYNIHKKPEAVYILNTYDSDLMHMPKHHVLDHVATMIL